MAHPSTLAVVGSRLASIAASIPQGSGSLCALAGDPAVAVSSGTVFPNNQRSQAFMQYLFRVTGTQHIADLAVIVSARSLLIVSDAAGRDIKPTAEGLPPGFDVRVVRSAELTDELLSPLAPLGLPPQRELDVQLGAFAGGVLSAWKSGRVPVTDAGYALSAALAVKDTDGINAVRKSAALCNAVLNKLVVPAYLDELAKALDAPEGTTAALVPMSAFAQRISAALGKPNSLPGLEQMSDPNYAVGIDPNVQSGEYEPNHFVRDRASSDLPLNLATGCIASYGAKYNGFVSYIARTFFVSEKAPPTAVAAYDFIFLLVDFIIKSIAPGKTTKAVYDEAMAHAKSLNPHLTELLFPDFGFSLGLHYMDMRQSINGKNEFVFRRGMVFAVRAALTIPAEGATPAVGVLLGETVYLPLEGDVPVELCTNKKRTSGEIFYSEGEKSAPAAAAVPEAPRDLKAITRSAKQDPSGADGGKKKKRGFTEDERLVLKEQVLAEKLQQWTASGGRRESATETEEYKVTELGRLAKGELQPFPSGAVDLDAAAMNAVLQTGASVDRTREVLYLSIGGRVVPFAIAVVNKLEVRTLGATHQLLVTFHSSQESNLAFRCNRNKAFVREVTVTGTDGAKFNQIANTVRDVLAVIKQKDQQRKQQQGVIAQGGLRLSKETTSLPLVKCRPPPVAGGKNGCEGTLYIHENGLRFTYSGGAPVDLLTTSIKHFIYQPSNNDICTILHVALKHPIMVGKKKTEHVQFVVEVREASEKLSSRRMTYEEELEQEEKEEKMIRQANIQFGKFSLQVQEKLKINVDMALDDFAITGVTSRAMSKIRGSENCLWSINELPFFVLNLREVEVCSLERVLPGNKNFDAAFVGTDLRTVQSITTIGMEELDTLKDFLLQAKTVYFESTLNLQWPVVLKTIREDGEFEPWGEGGWISTIEGDEGDEEGSGDDDDDSTYEESEDSDSEDDSDDDSDWAEEVDSDEDDDGSDGSEDSDASSALSWDELDRRAEEHDRKKARSDDSGSDDDSDRPRKKKPRTEAARGKAPAPSGKVAAKAPVSAPPTKGVFARPGAPVVPPRPGVPIPRPAPGALPQRR